MGRKHWRKLWQDKLRSSPKWTKLRMADKGFWFECFQMAQDDGAMMLRPGVPLTAKDLAYEFRTREKTISGWMNALEDAGLAVTNGGVFSLTGMTTLLQRDDRRAKGVAQHDDNATDETSDDNGLGHNNGAPKEEKRREDKKNPPKPPGGGYPDGFERFWKAFPVGNGGLKGSKKKAVEYWRRDKLEGQEEELISAISSFKASGQWQKGAIPYPQKFLNQKLYEEPPVGRNSTGDNGLPEWHPCFDMKAADGTRTVEMDDLTFEYGRGRGSGEPMMRVVGQEKWKKMDENYARDIANALKQ